MKAARAVLAGVAVCLVLTSCGDDGVDGDDGVEAGTEPLVADAAFPSAMVPLADGGLLYAERLTGNIRRVAEDGALMAEPVAMVEVSTEGQRGLLGLAVGQDDRVFAAWTDPELRLVVAQVSPGQLRRVWDGPATTELANGGRLAFAPDGSLVIGIGDLQDPDRVDDPGTPNGKLLRLDPDASPAQTPVVLSRGWNNPFAFTFTATGELWVADNSPGDEPERLVRGDGSRDVTELPDQTAPSGLASPAPDELLVCGYVSGDLVRYRIVDERAEREGTVTNECELGVVVLADERVAVATKTAILLVVE